MIKRKNTAKKLLSVLFLLSILSVPCQAYTGNESEQITGENKEQIEQGDYHKLSYNGKNYVYNSRIISILYAGIDSSDELITSNRYTIAPRADSIELVIMDDYHKTIRILALSRDTITSVSRYTMNGNYRDNYDTQLGYAYTYGDGGKESCNNLVSAVSDLIMGIPVHEYVITNNSLITEINKAVGGVTVTVPDDDLQDYYPEFTKGAVVTLNENNVEAFVRWRDTEEPFSNNGRMKRQQAFSSSFLNTFKDLISDDKEAVWDKINSLSSIMQTSIAKNQYLDLADRLLNETFSDENYYYILGEDVQGEQNDEVYLDEESLRDTILHLFYIEEETE